jgi:hypothetical protein
VRFRRTPQSQHIAIVYPVVNRRRKTNRRLEIPIVLIVDSAQRRAGLMLAVHNHVMNINMKFQTNVNAIEEIIHVPIIPGAAEIRPRAPALMAIQVLI